MNIREPQDAWNVFYNSPGVNVLKKSLVWKHLIQELL